MASSHQGQRVVGVVALLTVGPFAFSGCGRKIPNVEERAATYGPAVPAPPQFGLPELPAFGVSPSPTTNPEATDIDAEVAKLEERRERLIPLLDKAEDERADLVTKLREAGVTKASDLKDNPVPQRYAAALQKVSHDIAGIQSEIGRLDEAITHATALKRQAERERVRITDEELAALTVGSAQDLPLTATDPANLDALLAKELAGGSAGLPSPRPRTLSVEVIGQWEVTGGRITGSVEFTKGGNALVVWDDGIANALGQRGRSATLKYSVRGDTLKLEEPGDDPYRQQQQMTVEVVSADELIVVVTKEAMSFDWISGRLKRVK